MKREGEEKGQLSKLNNSKETLKPNRGMELLLRKNRRKEEPPKVFQIKFGKMLAFFRWEIHLLFDFHLIKRKRKSKWEDEKC